LVVQHYLLKGIDDICILKIGGDGGQFFLMVEVIGQKGVQFLISVVVFGYAHITLIYPVPKVDAQNGLDIEFRRLSCEIETGRSIIDIRQDQLGHMVFLCQL
jgi:hypothetical protein